MNRSTIFFIWLVALSAFSCSNCDITGGHFIKGVVIYRAEADFPVGALKIENIYDRDSSENALLLPMESPSRAVLYEFDPIQPLDLNQNVWFEISQNGSYQYAKNIQLETPDENQLMTDREKYFLLKKINFNLHNGDTHREGPKHTRIHVNTGASQGYFTIQANPHIALIRYFEVETGRSDSVYIRTSDIPQDTLLPYYILFDVQIDTFAVHSLDLNHIH